MWKLFVVLEFSLEPIWFYLVEYFRATGFLFFSFSTLSLKLSIFLMLIPSQELQKDSLFCCLSWPKWQTLPVLTARTALDKRSKGKGRRQEEGGSQIVEFMDRLIHG